MALPPLPVAGARDPALRDRVDARIAADEDKASPEAANYRPAEDERSCGTCGNFTPDGDMGVCEVVAGAIDRTYVSDLWEAAGEMPVPAGAMTEGGASPTPPLIGG